MAASTPTEASFQAGDVVLDCGVTLPDVRIVYAAHGTLTPARDNAIVFPTRFGGSHLDNGYLIGSGMALDPSRYFIIVPNMLGNGVSTSPSTMPGPLGRGRFPLVTIADNVRIQERLLRHLGVDRVALAVGWSMGGQQAYHWAAFFPDRVARLAVLCGAARTAPHTYVFLEGMRAALTADADWAGGDYTQPPLRGLRAIGRAWAGWALSQAWYRRHGWQELGYSTLEDFLIRYWEGMYLTRDANNLLAMISTWQACDVSAPFGGDMAAALGAITARAVIMPGQTDLYFPPEDSAAEVARLGMGELCVIPSDWGHYAGGGRASADTQFIDRRLRALLSE